jgi:hypothetical protein
LDRALAEGIEAQVGDVEEFLRAAFGSLTAEQLDRFWDDSRVVEIVREIPEYRELAAEIYGLSAHQGADR